jgi:predicted acyltransferase
MNSKPNSQIEVNTKFSITAYNKRENKNSLYQIIGLSFLTIAMMIVSAIVFRNIITAATLLVCSIALFLFFLQKPNAVIIEYNEKGIVISGEFFEWSKLIAWDMIEYEGLTEIDLITSTITNAYITFYVNKSNFHDYNRFLDYLYQNSEFKKDYAYSNNFQNFLRIVGLK